MKQKTTGQAGFTLIELTVSVFILMMLTAVIIANFRISEKSKRVTAARDIVLNAVRNAQNYTLTSRQIAGSSCELGGVEDKSPLNYRVHISQPSTTVTLYAEDKCNQLNTIETYTLTSGAQFAAGGFAVTAAGSTTSQNTLQIRFDTPFAPGSYATSTGAGASFNPYQTIEITLTDTGGGNAKTVTADGISGRIE